MRRLGSTSLSLPVNTVEKVVFYFTLSSWILLRLLGSTSLSLPVDTVEKVVFYFSLFMDPDEKVGIYFSLSLLGYCWDCWVLLRSLSPWILLRRLGSPLISWKLLSSFGSTSIWKRLYSSSLSVYLLRRLGSISLSGPSVLCCVRSVYSPCNLDSWVVYLDN